MPIEKSRLELRICEYEVRSIASPISVTMEERRPVHVGALPWATRAVEERFRDVVPGDVFLMNDP
jgi:N-methylhydantoinase B